MSFITDKEFKSFIHKSTSNELSILDQENPFYELIINVDYLFRQCLKTSKLDGNEVVKILIAQSHSYYLNASRMVMSGAVPEAFMLSRGVLESALYAFYIVNDFELGELWLTRSDNKKIFREKFTIRKILDKLNCDNSELKAQVNEAYDSSIDFGAHPNGTAISSNIRISSTIRQKQIHFSYLSDDELNLAHCFQETIKNGILALEILSQSDNIVVTTVNLKLELAKIKMLFNKLSAELKPIASAHSGNLKI